MELEPVTSEQTIVYKPQRRDSAGRTEQQQRAMDLPPASGLRPLYPGSKEQIALGGNAPQAPVISMVDEAYAEKVAETYAEFPRALYKKAFRRERDAAGRIVPGGEVTPLATADPIAPNYPVPLNVAQRNSIKGILATTEGSPATCTALVSFLPAGRPVTGCPSTRLSSKSQTNRGNHGN